MADRPTVLAGMLYSGEPTFSRAVAALEAQQDIDLRIVVFGGFDEWEAHRRLYDTFNGAGSDVDLLVKVDADMIVLHERLFAIVHSFLRQHSTLDRVTIGVHDWLSDVPIPGMHLWRSSVRWLAEPPALQTDTGTTTVRRKVSLIDTPMPLVLHAPEPSDLQAARYGARRALKAAARGQSRWEWRRVEQLLNTALDRPEPARRIAAAAVSAAFDDPDTMRRFVMEQHQPAETLRMLHDATTGWPQVADDALRHVRAALQNLEAAAAVPAPAPSVEDGRGWRHALHPRRIVRRVGAFRDRLRPEASLAGQLTEQELADLLAERLAA